MACAAAQPSHIDSVMSGDKLNIVQDIVISDRAIVDMYSININEPVFVQNEGRVYGDIFLCDVCSVKIRNSGTINGTIFVSDKAELVQVINTSADITKLKVSGSNFSILVNSVQPLNLSDIMKISGGASKIILDDSFIILGNRINIQPLSLTSSPEIELIGTVIIDVDDITTIDGKEILSNVSGDGTIKVSSKNLDPLYVANTTIDNGKVYVNVERETDYQKLFDGNLGGFLNSLRMTNPDNSTILAMDNAETMSELNSVMDKSVLLNPINLMKPVKTFDNFEVSSFHGVNRPEDFDFETISILSATSSLYAGKFSLTTDIDKITITASTYFGTLENTDDLNEFSGLLYGGNVYGFYSDKDLWIDAGLGFTIAKFETYMIFDGNNVTYNPTGVSVYGVSDIGMKYEVLGNNFYLSPFIGIGGYFASVLHQSETDVFIRAGGVAGFSTEAIGIRNDYQISITAYTNNAYTAEAKVKFYSVADMAGGGMSVGITNDDNGTSYKISATAALNF